MTYPMTLKRAEKAANQLDEYISVHACRELAIDSDRIQECADRLISMLEVAKTQRFLNKRVSKKVPLMIRADTDNAEFAFHTVIGESAPVIVEFDYEPAEPLSLDFPGCPEDLEMIGVLTGGIDIYRALSGDCLSTLSGQCFEFIRKLRDGEIG